eukprot:CAMPEP_0203674270 /NCGR_PEP_ID=MMETSP0090-20130426/15548_1 /ASSEMBLY_ACC=CAM_ASM_001088 /TAXON_ID=426623 /ORGANISM="Chaetoceros affinis, Strain CCMP159" /LENGTH=288 /DNA_ID=CAMNT_0050540103 /DNA_START=37 /DNA_END=900 /DNA_ORIENTATION=-
MGAASSILKLAESEKWDEIQKFLLDKDIANEMKIENLRYRDKYKGSPLQCAIYRKAPVYIIVLIVDICGDDILMETNQDGNNLLHHAAIAGSSDEVLTLIMRVGGQKVITEHDNRGRLPIHYSVDRFGKPNERVFRCFVKEGISQEIGGPYGMAGIFVKDKQNHSAFDFLKLRLSLDDLVRTIKTNFYGQPFLHAAIGNVSREEIRLIVRCLRWSVSTYDRYGRLPIHFAAERGLTWENGMDLIVEAYEESVELHDSKRTGLLPFAIAAAEKNNDLNTVYNLIHRRVN